MTASRAGRVRKKPCDDHKHVEWDVKYASLPQHNDTVKSPSFTIEGMRYRFQLRGNFNCVELIIFRKDPFEGCVRCFVGLKRADGTYHHEIQNKVIDPEAWIVSIDTFRRPVLEKRYLSPDGLLIFSALLSVERDEETKKICGHGLLPSSKGRIKRERCSKNGTSWHVEWNLEYALVPDDDYSISSPIFGIGTREYLLDLRANWSTVYLRLFHIGLPSDRALKCFVGVKRRNGSCHHVIKGTEVDLKKIGKVWTLGWSHDFPKRTLEKQHSSPDGRITFFLRMNNEPTDSNEIVCSYCAAELNPEGDGDIREEQCSGHKHVEWNVEYASMIQQFENRISPAFQIGAQQYRLVLTNCLENDDAFELGLFRRGPCLKRTELCTIEMKLGSGPYLSRAVIETVDKKDLCEMWTHMKLYEFRQLYHLESRGLNLNGRVTFNMQMHNEGTRCGAETSSEGTSPLDAGSFVETELSSFKQVDWNIECKQSLKFVVSPLFSHEGQAYFFQFLREFPLRLNAFRLGPTDVRSVSWWLIVKHGEQYYETQCGAYEIDKTKYYIESWKFAGMTFLLEQLNKNDPLIVSFLITLMDNVITPADEYLAIVRDGVQMNWDPLHSDFVVFRGENWRYDVKRVVLVFRLRIFKSMFSTDCTESRTGVVSILEYGVVFVGFLRYVTHGDEDVINVANCFDLFLIADRYLFEELKRACLPVIKDAMVSEYNIFSAAEFAYAHARYDIVEKVAAYLLRNQEIVETADWRKFCSSNSLAAEALDSFMQDVLAEED